MNDNTQKIFTLGAGFIALALMLVVLFALQTRPDTSKVGTRSNTVKATQGAPTNGTNAVTQSVTVPEQEGVTATVTVDKKK